MTSLTKALCHAVLIATVTSAASPAAAAPNAKSICTARNAAAAMREIVPAELPPFAQVAHLSGSAVVRFDLDARGVARNAAIVKSTGHDMLDRAAKQAALEQGYAPEIQDCQTVAGTYQIIVDFPS